jgi:hypothetical protein
MPLTASARSRQVLVEGKEDDAPRYVGRALSIDDDIIIEQVELEGTDNVIELSDNESEDMAVDDEEAELSKSSISVCGHK